MRYIKADQVLPKELLAEIQRYVDGQTLYIPRKAHNRRAWGGGTDYKAELAARNESICRAYRAGCAVGELAEMYHLSGKSIRRILKEGENSHEI